MKQSQQYKTLYLILVLGLVAITACNKLDDCFKSNGKVVRIARELAPFDSIKVETNVELILVQDTAYHIEIETGEHLQSEIGMEVSSSRLLLRNNNSCNWVRDFNIPVKAYVHFKDLSLVTNKSVATVSNQDSIIIINHDFEIRTVSSGDYNLKGRFKDLIVNTWVAVGNTYISGIAKNTFIWCTGSSKVDARNLKSNFVGIYSDTPTDCYVYAAENLNSTVAWIGNIHCFGKPATITNKELSTGKLIKQ